MILSSLEKALNPKMTSSVHVAAATVMQPNKAGLSSRSLRSNQSLCKAFGLEYGVGRVSCSLQTDVKNLAIKCLDASKIAGFALATSAIVVSGASAEGVPKRLTYDEIQSKTYMEVKGTGTANQCPTLEGGSSSFAFKSGKYKMKKLCLEPTSFTVKAEGVNKNSPLEFQKTKLMTRLTYTLDEIEGPFEVTPDGKVKFEEEDGIDYAAVTVQLPGGERVPFLFTVKQLVASGTPDKFSGNFVVPSYRGSSFLDPKGRGGSTGYDNAVALPAGGRGDEEELVKENNKDVSASTGTISLSVSSSKAESGEVIGVFESVQPSDTDLGSKAPKDVKIQGVWWFGGAARRFYTGSERFELNTMPKWWICLFSFSAAAATGGDRRRPAATGGDRRRPAATGGDGRRRWAATTTATRGNSSNTGGGVQGLESLGGSGASL